MENLIVGSGYRIQILKEAPAEGSQPQLTKNWEFTEEDVDSLQILIITTYPAIVRLESVLDLRQRPNLTVSRNKIDKLVLPKPSSQPVRILSITGHRHLETKQHDLLPQRLCSSPLTHPLLKP